MEEDIAKRSYLVDCDKFRLRVERSVSPLAFKKYLEALDDEESNVSELLDKIGDTKEIPFLANKNVSKNAGPVLRRKSSNNSKLMRIDTNKNSSK